ncbi:MAG: lipoate--protein ligase [Actinomycetota bacterium]|nr:lipoate--protein ligase [Actinomycetota bacterium]
MYIVDNNSDNAYFNIASEEYLLKNKDEDFFMLYINPPSIIIGKNQNTLAEINTDYVNENNISVVRRLSGGGAVYHCHGNLNFSFIINDNEESFMDFKKFTQPIISILDKMGVKAQLSGRNDILIDDKKISGNAQFKSRGRMIHHGTLLFSSDLSKLEKSLKANPLKFKDKATKSVKSRVANICDYLENPIDIYEFKKLVISGILEVNKDCKIYDLTEDDKKSISKLVEDKYFTWEWNYGYSPKYNYSNEEKFACGLVQVYLLIEEGFISSIKFYGDFFGKRDIAELEKKITGIKHDKKHIEDVLKNTDLDSYFAGITSDELLGLLF